MKAFLVKHQCGWRHWDILSFSLFLALLWGFYVKMKSWGEGEGENYLHLIWIFHVVYAFPPHLNKSLALQEFSRAPKLFFWAAEQLESGKQEIHSENDRPDTCCFRSSRQSTFETDLYAKTDDQKLLDPTHHTWRHSVEKQVGEIFSILHFRNLQKERDQGNYILVRFRGEESVRNSTK